jgi:predicted signal transduction protein with EAL and GGDEF domain
MNMNNESLIHAMPDVVAFVRPDGLITHHLGGRGLPFMAGSTAGGLAGQRLADVLPTAVFKAIARLIRRSRASRESCESEFAVAGATYQARVAPQGAERFMCVLRHVPAKPEDERQVQSDLAIGAVDRRFMTRFESAVTAARLREQSLAVGIIFLDGLGDISQILDFSVGQQIVDELLERLVQSHAAQDSAWFIGQIGDHMLGVVIERIVDRDRIQAFAQSLCASVALPLQVHDATFHITPAVGVAILGDDAGRADALLDHARAAMFEARRAGAERVQFYSDTLRLLPLARLDLARELRRAIELGQIFLRYFARHELSTGRLSGIQACVRWTDPLRGEIPPAQFLPLANATGLAAELSRSALKCLVRDSASLRQRYGADVPISFAPLRQHVSSGQFLRDCRRLLAPTTLGRLELRISERSLAALSRPEHSLGALAEWGADLVIDEMGRSFSSLPRLARMPLKGLQIDRAVAVAAGAGGDALRACRAVAALAKALDLEAITAGVDDQAQHDRLLAAGFSQGLGDFYPAVAP